MTAKGTFFLAQAAAPALREAHGVLVIVEDVGVVPAVDVVPGALRREGGAGDADPGARARARAGGAGLRRRARPGRRRARARRSAGQPRRCSDGSARPRTSQTRSPILAGAGFVTGSTLVVDGGRLLKSGSRQIP